MLVDSMCGAFSQAWHSKMNCLTLQRECMLHLCDVGLQEKDLRTQHTLQLDAVHLRLQTILAKKDATIQALKAELEAALLNMQQLEEEDESS